LSSVAAGKAVPVIALIKSYGVTIRVTRGMQNRKRNEGCKMKSQSLIEVISILVLSTRLQFACASATEQRQPLFSVICPILNR
jgi:hypothetical protein